MKPYNPDLHHRRSIRLEGYDYTRSGAYFVTIGTWQGAHVFGDIAEGTMSLNAAGRIAQECWLAIPDHFPDVDLDAFVVMPNHVHGIVVIASDVGTPHDSGSGRAATGHPTGPPRRSLGAIIGSFKSAASKRINAASNAPGTPIWHRNFYEHVIRDETNLAWIIHEGLEQGPFSRALRGLMGSRRLLFASLRPSGATGWDFE